MHNFDRNAAAVSDSEPLLLHCQRCYHLSLPFTSEAQARMSAAHPECVKIDVPKLPHTALKSVRKARKQDATRFSKRRKTYIKRTHELSRDCGAQIYTVVRKNNNFWVYNSHPQDGTWPPSYVDITRSYPLPQIFSPQSFPSPLRDGLIAGPSKE
ncbi:hypothetical protein GGR57DRAFT_255723 [Xylariaceae sp. FL1272]|nr:hypothetical protein GGR57DRAFT_255723 [Xylariaceae sp. FL1272]